MKYFVLLFLFPLLASAQNQNQAVDIFGNSHFPKAKILLIDSSHVYFKKTVRTDTIFKTPVSEVKANLKGVPIAVYDDWNDALLRSNKENARGNILQLTGLGISLVGYGILVAAVSDDDSPQNMYKTGGYIAVAGGALSILGIAIEFRSHRHLKRYDIISKANPYP